MITLTDYDAERTDRLLHLLDLFLPICPGSNIQIAESTEAVLCYCGKIFYKSREAALSAGSWELPKHKEKREHTKLQVD